MPEQHSDALTPMTDEEAEEYDRHQQRTDELAEKVTELGHSYPEGDEQRRLEILLRFVELMVEEYQLEVVEKGGEGSPLKTERAMYDLVMNKYMEMTPVVAAQLSCARFGVKAGLIDVERARHHGYDSGPPLQDLDLKQEEPSVVTLAARILVAQEVTNEDGSVVTVEEAAEIVWENCGW